MPEELSSDALQEDKLSSDGAAAMALSSGPVLPPKPSGVVVNEEPSVVLSDPTSEVMKAIAAATAATATPAPAPAVSKPEDDLDARRRKTIKLDPVKVEQMSAALQAKRAAEKAASEAPIELAAAPRVARPGATTAPVPTAAEDESFEMPRRSNRSLVIGIVSVVAVLGLLGVARTMFQSDDPADGAAKSATSAATSASPPTPGAGVTANGTATTALPQPTQDATPTPGPTTPPKKDPPKTYPQQGAGQPVAPVTTPKATGDVVKKPVPPKGNGTIVRDVPF
jgi:hypothetical protein